MSDPAKVKLIYGTYPVSPDAETGSVAHVVDLLDLLWNLGVKNLDTAQVYGQSEATLGKVNISQRDFIVDTKHGAGFRKGTATVEGILNHGQEARKILGPIDVYFLHAPDNTLPLETQLEGIQKLYETGAFKRFGLSNYSPEDTETAYEIMQQKGWVLPTVYQGNYNAYARHYETILFPVLRKLGMSFYAYSPLAGGLLAKTKEQFKIAGGRWQAGTPSGNIHRAMYGKEEMVDGLDKWEEIAKMENATMAELGYRWVRFHSALKGEHGDGLIFGASQEKIEQTVGWLNQGPLSEGAVKAIDAVWENIKDVAPISVTSTAKKNKI
ncbi:hypothetical protein ABW20_dc0106309 [Dactylellina cionopaga]|nr:hypothetical protein ABW20_dc0106309 [Dactylellina cionopaga]